MLFKTKEAVNAAARNVANNLVEVYSEYRCANRHNEVPSTSFQEFIQSRDWEHAYNLTQRNAFVNLSEVHHLFVAELTQVLQEEHCFILKFRLTDKGLSFVIEDEGDDAYTFEVWSLGAAIDGVVLKSPLNP